MTLFSFIISIQHSKHLVQMEDRIKATQEEAKKTEKLFQVQLQEINQEREEKENKLKSAVEEKENKLRSITEERSKLAEFSQSTEELIKQLKEEREKEKEQRAFMHQWLKDKFAAETQAWQKKWTALLHQIESNRDNLNQVCLFPTFRLLFHPLIPFFCS